MQIPSKENRSFSPRSREKYEPHREPKRYQVDRVRPRRCGMLKVMTGIAAAAALVVTLVAAPQQAEARWRHHHRGGAVAAGIIGGLAAGAIIGSAANGYYGPSYGYYGGGPVYYGPRCYWTRERFWNGYRWRSHRVRVCN
jgi:hypothetical protein